MKFSNIYQYILVLLAMFTGVSCTRDFEEINTDPISYSSGNFNPNFLLTSAQLNYTGSTDFAYDTWRANLIYCSTMMQGFSTVISYWAGDKYILNEGYTSAYWGTSAVGAYTEQVKPVTELIEITKDKAQYKNLHQVARIWRAIVMERITDLYGDVPYTDAGMGYHTNNYYPKYDSQQSIYAGLLKEVEEASAALGNDGGTITGDAIYKGDIGKWKRFGYSLLLRMAMRLTKVDENTAKTFAQKAVGNTMTGNGDNAFIIHDESGGRVTQNRNSQVLRGDGGQEHFYVRWSDTFINFLKATNDPRLGKVAVTRLYPDESTKDKDQNPNAISAPSAQKGMPNGKDLSGIAAQDIRQHPSFTSFIDYSSPSPGMIKRTGPTFILTYAETEFLLAEAAQRWAIGGSAAAHYQEGLKNALTFLGQYDEAMAISETEADQFAGNHPYNTANGLSMINNQYWAHTVTMLDFYETWSNWRRSGYPQLNPVIYPNNNTGGTIPRRFPYPAAEALTNADNYNAASSSVTGGDKLTGRVWWDK